MLLQRISCGLLSSRSSSVSSLIVAISKRSRLRTSTTTTSCCQKVLSTDFHSDSWAITYPCSTPMKVFQRRALMSSSASKEKPPKPQNLGKMPIEDYTNFQSLSYLCSVAFLFGFLGAFFLFGLMIGLLIVFGWVGLLYYIHLVNEEKQKKQKEK
ncbi:hypothetical protein QR680_005860 [Steinernema hermaphroditum]|uniref:Transmembrane protein n=1 Tax=Steinernema hermaphroditum TaxID=289476 RepID=A0AA39LW42_9BILA|nr:hypothetical protein QR680_005860 [Steinernema hermaphroditum]